MAKTITLDDDVRSILERSSIAESTLTLPPEQLDRPLYDRVNKVITAAGGKWNRGKRCHIFAQDPREALGLAIESGTIENRQQTYQEFFTPVPLAERIASDVAPGDRVLEPSAGIGRIANAAERNGARVFCCELHLQNCAELRKNPKLLIWEGDFLTFGSDLLRPFDKVLMNPPFSGGQEYLHIQRAFDFLRPGGTLVSVMSPALTFRQQKADKSFRDWLNAFDHDIEELPDGTFKESGTGVRTVLVTIRKP